VRTLRHMMDVRDALGIIQKTSDDVEFSFALNGILERSSESQALAEQTPALSGTHRIDGEPYTFPAEEITTRTGPGRR
jgi:sensor domain CHASE-containing protein